MAVLNGELHHLISAPYQKKILILNVEITDV